MRKIVILAIILVALILTTSFIGVNQIYDKRSEIVKDFVSAVQENKSLEYINHKPNENLISSEARKLIQNKSYSISIGESAPIFYKLKHLSDAKANVNVYIYDDKSYEVAWLTVKTEKVEGKWKVVTIKVN